MSKTPEVSAYAYLVPLVVLCPPDPLCAPDGPVPLDPVPLKSILNPVASLLVPRSASLADCVAAHRLTEALHALVPLTQRLMSSVGCHPFPKDDLVGF